MIIPFTEYINDNKVLRHDSCGQKLRKFVNFRE